MKLIILEGPDGSGKTTLAETLQRITKGVVLHGASMGDAPGIRPDNEKIMMNFHDTLIAIAERNLAFGHWVILDRLWLSHIEYGLAKGTLTPIRALEYQDHFVKKLARQACYVFCLDPECIRIHRENLDPEHPYDDEYMRMVLQGYAQTYTLWESLTNSDLSTIPTRSYFLTDHPGPEKIEREALSIMSWAFGLT